MAPIPDPVPNLHAVSSSSVAAMGFRGGTLFVKFKSGKTYQYQGVTEGQFIGLMDSQSVGRSLQSIIHNAEAYPVVCCDEV